MRGSGAQRRYDAERRREKLTLPDGRKLHWTVHTPPGGKPVIECIGDEERPAWWPPSGRDLLREVGHPDGVLATVRDEPWLGPAAGPASGR